MHNRPKSKQQNPSKYYMLADLINYLTDIKFRSTTVIHSNHIATILCALAQLAILRKP